MNCLTRTKYCWTSRFFSIPAVQTTRKYVMFHSQRSLCLKSRNAFCSEMVKVCTLGKKINPVFYKYCSSSLSSPDNPDNIGKISARIAMIFTCKVCKTRSMKTFSKTSYEKGVVIVQCPGCQNHHLVADHLNWFTDIKHK